MYVFSNGYSSKVNADSTRVLLVRVRNTYSQIDHNIRSMVMMVDDDDGDKDDKITKTKWITSSQQQRRRRRINHIPAASDRIYVRSVRITDR